MKKVILAFFTALIFLFIIAGCVADKKNAPWNYPNVEWYSDNPIIELHTEYSGEPSIGYVEINGKRTEIYLCWGPPTYTFTIRVYNAENGISIGTDELLLQGKVKYDKTSATLVIKEDYIFDNKYSRIVLFRKDIN